MNEVNPCSGKPIWTLRALLPVIPGIPLHLLRVAPTIFGVPISNALREHVMLAVTGQNRCVYCTIAHTGFGRVSGMSEKEIADILAGEYDDQQDDARLVLVYVRDLAVRDFQSRNEDLFGELLEKFTPRQRSAIISSAHVINFANRFGNTFDVARCWVTGRKPETRTSAVDLLAVSAAFVVGALPLLPLIAPVVAVGYLQRWRRQRRASA